MVKYPQELTTLIACLAKLPGVGRRTAERFAFSLLDWKTQDRKTLAAILDTLEQTIKYCSECGCILTEASCHYCDTSKRDPSILCIISSPKEVFAIEETGSFKGLYHVWGPLLSPIDGIEPDIPKVELLKKRIESLAIEEVILAFDSTLEGDATALYLHDILKKEGRRISKLALGMPMGSSLDFLDENTLTFAFKGRQCLH